jgi:hypothetical protein
MSDFSAQGILAYEQGSRRPTRANTVVRCPFLPATLWAVILDRMSDVTQILSAIERGDKHAAEQLLPLVYDELRRLAAAQLAGEKPGQTLDPTALVHEAYLQWEDNGPGRADRAPGAVGPVRGLLGGTPSPAALLVVTSATTASRCRRPGSGR